MINGLRWIKGWVSFYLIGADSGKALSEGLKQGILIWKVQKRDGKMECRCYCHDYKKFARLARKRHCQIKVATRHGFPFLLHRYRFRVGLLAGAIGFFAFLAVMSCFVWQIDINGNYRLSDAQILQAAEQMGVKKGAFKFGIDFDKVESQLQQQFGGFAWLSINEIGTHVMIEISEMEPKPETVKPSSPCNVVAGYTGIIRDVRPLGGQAVVKAGDVVKEGDLLISGIIDDQLEQTHYYHAYGSVTAEVIRTVSFSQNLNSERTIYTGVEKTKKYLSIFGGRIPLFFEKVEDNMKKQSVQYHPVSIFGFTMPFGIEEITYQVYQTERLRLDEQGARRMLVEQATQWEEENLKGAKILNRQESFQQEGDQRILQIEYTVEQEIGVQKEILLSNSMPTEEEAVPNESGP